MTSKKKVAANRINGRKSHGPTNTASTRFNATKHGLLAAGITELDDAEGYQITLDDLMRDKNPVGPMEIFLVRAAALEMVRWTRARRFEAEYLTAELHPPIQAPGLPDLGRLLEEGEILDPGLPAAISPESAQRLVTTYQRYESFFSNRLFRVLHELERLQRTRQGEILPAPATVDVAVHVASVAPDSAVEAAEQPKALLDEQE